MASIPPAIAKSSSPSPIHTSDEQETVPKPSTLETRLDKQGRESN